LWGAQIIDHNRSLHPIRFAGWYSVQRELEIHGQGILSGRVLRVQVKLLAFIFVQSYARVHVGQNGVKPPADAWEHLPKIGIYQKNLIDIRK
jgi:hypothetical protein